MPAALARAVAFAAAGFLLGFCAHPAVVVVAPPRDAAVAAEPEAFTAPDFPPAPPAPLPEGQQQT